MSAPPEGLSQADFEAIEAAVMETERGRWFLAEVARRARAQDTALILGAVDRLEARAVENRADAEAAREHVERAASLLRYLAEIAKSIRLEAALPTPLETASRVGDITIESTTQLPLGAPAPGAKTEAPALTLSALDRLSLTDKLKLFR